MDPRNWKLFERLVAAIHRARAKDAVVKWDDSIDGRQFDVTIRFRNGLYDFVTVVECKATHGRVPVKEVEAFVTKAADVHADKAVIASTSGFQEGCYRVAQRHGVVLITVTESVEVPEELLAPEIIDALNIWDVRVVLDDGGERILEEQDGKLEWLLLNGRIVSDPSKPSLSSIVDRLLQEGGQNYPEEEHLVATFDPAAEVRFPYETVTLCVASMSFRVRNIQARMFKGAAPPAHVAARAFKIHNELTNEMLTVPAGGLDVGRDTKIAPGRFYYSPTIGFSYYCAAIDGDMISWVLVESYQHGRLMQAEYTQEKKHALSYIEVTDPEEIKRLGRLLAPIRSTD